MDKSKTMMIIIIVLLVLLLGTVVAVTIFLLRLTGDNNSDYFHDQPPPPLVETVRVADTVQVTLGEGRISTNLALGPGGTDDIVSTEVIVAISASDESALDDFMPVFTGRIHMARAMALEVLGSLTLDEVRTVEGRRMAAELITHRLQEEFETNLIVRVYFSDWSTQRGR